MTVQKTQRQQNIRPALRAMGLNMKAFGLKYGYSLPYLSAVNIGSRKVTKRLKKFMEIERDAYVDRMHRRGFVDVK